MIASILCQTLVVLLCLVMTALSSILQLERGDRARQSVTEDASQQVSEPSLLEKRTRFTLRVTFNLATMLPDGVEAFDGTLSGTERRLTRFAISDVLSYLYFGPGSAPNPNGEPRLLAAGALLSNYANGLPCRGALLPPSLGFDATANLYVHIQVVNTMDPRISELFTQAQVDTRIQPSGQSIAGAIQSQINSNTLGGIVRLTPVGLPSNPGGQLSVLWYIAVVRQTCDVYFNNNLDHLPAPPAPPDGPDSSSGGACNGLCNFIHLGSPF